MMTLVDGDALPTGGGGLPTVGAVVPAWLRNQISYTTPDSPFAERYPASPGAIPIPLDMPVLKYYPTDEPAPGMPDSGPGPVAPATQTVSPCSSCVFGSAAVSRTASAPSAAATTTGATGFATAGIGGVPWWLILIIGLTVYFSKRKG